MASRLSRILILIALTTCIFHFFVLYKTNSPILLVTYTGKKLKCPIPKQYQIPHGPLIAIASFPGSGNTWTRFLIEEASGLYTGTVYPQANPREFPGSNRYNGSVVAIKTHRLYKDFTTNSKSVEGDLSMLDYDKAIVLIRHPRDAILADTNRHFTDNPVGFMKVSLTGLSLLPFYVILCYIDPMPLKYMISLAKRWPDFIINWLTKFNKDRLVINYDVMKNNPQETAESIVSFIGAPLNTDGIECIRLNSSGYAFRSTKVPRPPLLPKSVEEILKIGFEKTRSYLSLYNISFS